MERPNRRTILFPFDLDLMCLFYNQNVETAFKFVKFLADKKAQVASELDWGIPKSSRWLSNIHPRHAKGDTILGGLVLFKHEKQLLDIVKVEKANPTYAAMLSEQLGGPQGELKAAMQYISQSFRIKNQEIKDVFLDIAAEELGHMEMVATSINLLNGHNVSAEAVSAGHIENQVLTGLSPFLVNASGVPWTGAYVNVTGDLVADILSNIAAEQRAKVVYEYLHRQIQDEHVQQMIDFLLNREEAHNTLFREALAKVQDTGSNRDWGVDEDARLYFDLSIPGKYFDLNQPQPPKFQNPDLRQ